jgi:melibiose permease/lactose/raffinose/galactose permease
VALFTDFGLEGTAFVVVFGILYLMWGISYTANDISYWSMFPALSVDQKEREIIGAVVRICANIGLFAVVVLIVPLTEYLGARAGSLQKGYFVFAVLVTVILLAGQCVTLFGVKKTDIISSRRQSTSLRELVRIIVKNDQLLFTAIAMSLFMIGYITTTSFGLYFFKYAYGDEGMYPVFAMILGVSQISALIIFPMFRKIFKRGTLYTAAIVLILAGYTLFFLAPTDTMLFIAAAGVLIFVGQGFVQILMLMFLADSVDYGHWKLGKRNDSITFSLQPLIYKMGGAVSSGVVSVVLILSGINEAENAAGVSTEGLFLMKVAMLVFPALCILMSYIIYRKKYIIDSRYHAQILADLRDRGELSDAEELSDTEELPDTEELSDTEE